MSDEQVDKGNPQKAKMLEALSKKQKIHNTNNFHGPRTGSKVGAGNTTGAAPKMHRRKVGSA